MNGARAWLLTGALCLPRGLTFTGRKAIAAACRLSE